MFTLNLVIIVVLLSAAGLWLWLRLSDPANRSVKKNNEERHYTIEEMIEYTKERINEFLHSDLEQLGLGGEDLERRINQRAELSKALQGSAHGDKGKKAYTKSFISHILVNGYGLTEQNIDKVIPFDYPADLSAQDKFDILLYFYKKKYGYQAFKELIKQHKLDEPKKVIEGGKTVSYIITKEEIEAIYKKRVKRLLDFDDKLEIVTQRVFQQYKGFGVVDEIRDMAIDGVSSGVSGLPDGLDEEVYEYASKIQGAPKVYESVYVFFAGKTIRLSFLSFGSVDELRRVCSNIYRYNNPGQLSEARGYIMNHMQDGSRVVVLRPPLTESWVFFVRKFTSERVDPYKLITDENAELPIKTAAFLMKGCRTVAITGEQGSGKTTFLKAIVGFISGKYNIRSHEAFFEAHLRMLYPERNIVPFQETDHISGQKGLDVSKKTDGNVSILGEVATDIEATWAIQTGQVASLFTLFTHHAKTFKLLVESLRNSLAKAGLFSNEVIAEKQVVSVLNFDIHWVMVDGHRYIERITECVPLDEQDYPIEFMEADDLQTILKESMRTMTEYFRRQQDRKLYKHHDIVVFENGRYVAKEPITEQQRLEMEKHMEMEDAAEFRDFMSVHWGISHGH